MYIRNGITYLSEKEYRLAEPELLRQKQEKQKRSKDLIIALLVILLPVLFTGWLCKPIFDFEAHRKQQVQTTVSGSPQSES